MPWIGAPRWLYTPCHLVLGWSLLYTAGAVVYGLKRPDPSPGWFGFHKVFHALTIAAFTTHHTAIVLAVT